MKYRLIILFVIIFSLFALEAAAFSKDICLDTDASSSISEYKRGYVSNLHGVFWDECDDNTLIEMYCLDGKPESKRIECEKGCTRGSCSRYALFKPTRLKMPLFARLSQYFGFEQSTKKVSKYEVEKIDTNLINSAFRDIDKRLSLIEANIPEENVFPIILETNDKKRFKAVANDGMVQLTETKLLLPDLSTSALLYIGEMNETGFYNLIDQSDSVPITKKGKAFQLFISK